MKRLELLLLTAIVGSGLLVIGCGGSDTGTTPAEQPAASAPAEAAAPAATTEPAATSAPSQADAADEAAGEDAGQEKTRFVPPIRGTANIEILAPVTKVEGNDVVTRLKIRNASLGAIALLRVDETWYDKAGNAMPGDTQRWRKPFLPGEVIDIELRVPKSSRFYQNNFQFSHANGKIDVKTVKSFPKPIEG